MEKPNLKHEEPASALIDTDIVATKRPSPRRLKWIEDTGLLRDEGVLFGIATAQGVERTEALKARLDAIDSYYLQLSAPHQSRYDDLTKQKEKAEEKIGVLQREAEALTKPIPDLPTVTTELPLMPERLQGPRLMFLAGATLLGCIGSIVLVYDLLEHSRLNYPLPVSIGLTLLALFSQFAPLSLLYKHESVAEAEAERPERWKRYFAEWGVVLAAAVFVTVWSFSDNLWVALSGLILLLVVFAISGRLLLGTLTRGAEWFRHLVAERKRRTDRQAAEETRKEKKGAIREEVVALGKQIDQYHKDMVICEIALKMFEHQAKERKALFLSEYELARQVPSPETF
jgi:hypothetical protein